MNVKSVAIQDLFGVLYSVISSNPRYYPEFVTSLVLEVVCCRAAADFRVQICSYLI